MPSPVPPAIRARPSAVLAAVAVLAGCTSEGARQPLGGPCFGSAECQSGLVCDLAADPAVCTEPAASPPVDADPTQPPGPTDASPPDAPPPDATQPDATPI